MAVGILTFLLILTATLFQVTQQELQTARNNAESIRAELLVEGAFSIAQGFLNHDLDAHPTYTSLDNAWTSYFNNTWAAGKPWLWARDNNNQLLSQNGVLPGDSQPDPFTGEVRQVRGIPEINLSAMADTTGFTVEIPGSDPTFDPGLSLRDFGPSIYVPRIDLTNITGGELPAGLNDAANNAGIDEFLNGNHPFAWTMDLNVPPLAQLPGFPPAGIPSRIINERGDLEDENSTPPLIYRNNIELLPAEQIHFLTDVDNDGDGLNDSVWIPLAGDRLLDRDGLDNNLNGIIDEPGEPGVFFYRIVYNLSALNDNIITVAERAVLPLEDDLLNLDTNVQGTAIVFTVPYPFILQDSDGNVFPIDDNGLIDLLRTSAGVQPTEDVFFEGRIFDGVPAARYIPGVDNDFDLVVDNGLDASHILLSRAALVYTGRINNGEDELKAVYPYSDLVNAIINGNGRVLAEPLSEIVGRAAILIRDEASKVNINAAGAHSHIPGKTVDNLGNVEIPLQLALSDGASPAEYNLSVLPNVGPLRADRLWTTRMGAPYGGAAALASTDRTLPAGFFLDPLAISDPLQLALTYDVSLPGYGIVDDDGNILQMLLNGLDDDGDSVFYMNDGIDNDLDGVIDNFEERFAGIDEGFTLWDYDGDGDTEFATPEGLDDPGEFQRFRPFRHRIAETDSGFGVLPDFNVPNFSTPSPGDNDGDDIADEIGELGDRNYLTTQQIKPIREFEVIQGQTFPPSTQEFYDRMKNFVTAHSSDKNERTRQYAAIPFDIDGDFVTDGYNRFRLQPSQRTVTGVKVDYNVASANEIARAIVDDWAYTPSQPLRHENLNPATDDFGATSTFTGVTGNYARGLRQEDTTIVSDQQFLGEASLNNSSRFVFESDNELRAYQLAVNIKDSADADLARTTATVTIPDPWIDMNILQVTTEIDRVTAQISYTQSGIEPIRINEIMARPVRRVEAEATTDSTDPSYDPEYDPNYFNPGDFDFEVTSTRERIIELATTTGFNYGLPNDAFEDPWRVDVPTDNGTPHNGSFMGLATVYRTYGLYTQVSIPDPSTVTGGQVRNIPNLIQFSFRSSEELPAGRYYLTLDSRMLLDSGIIPTINNSSEMGFIFKRGTLTDDLFNNPDYNPLINQPLDHLDLISDNSLWRTPAAVDNLGRAFLQYLPPTNDATEILTNHFGYTVEIPSVESGEYLHVGIRMYGVGVQPDLKALAINWFDFSQEPDHEWVEVVNIDPDNAYDLSEWELVVEGARRTVATIPQNTFIAPGGSLILGFDKFDFGNMLNTYAIQQLLYVQPPPGSLLLGALPEDLKIFERNGIGLARGTVDVSGTTYSTFANTIVPQIFGQARNNIFDRTDGPNSDFVDRDGDGEPESAGVDHLVQSTVDGIQTPLPDQSWDRIVPLSIKGSGGALGDLQIADANLILQAIQSANTNYIAMGDPGLIGNVVLQGGFFPNEPELDGYDNDGDNAILSRDGFDNDGDALGTFDGIDEAFEGIDEGAYLRTAYIPEDNDFPFHNGKFLPIPGGFDNRALVAFDLTDPVLRDSVRTIDPAIPAYSYISGEVDPLTGIASDSPRWKEFNERRLFPGDNVIVSLYEGNALNNRVVDRVTYTQRDVENASIDDVLEIPEISPPIDDNGDGINDRVRQPLDARYPSFWPDNTMGIDFYRSIERKHPLYSGDRFGTQNRFQATDGNYDDWGERMTRFERQVDLDNNGALATPATLNRLLVADGIYDEFAHGFRASPGAPNLAHRLIENLDIIEGTGAPNLNGGQFDGIGTGTPLLRRWHFTRPRLAQNPFLSTGDAMRLPHIDRSDQMFTVTESDDTPLDTSASLGPSYLLDLASPNIAWVTPGTTLRTDSTIHQTMLGQVVPPLRASFVDGYFASNPATSRFLSFFVDTPTSGGVPSLATDLATPKDYSDDLRAVLSGIATTDPVNLSVARADVYPMVRNNGGNNQADFRYSSSNIPGQWAPVMLYPVIDPGTGNLELADDSIPGGNLTKQFLLDSNLLPLLAPQFVDETRSPTLSRAAVYTSTNNLNNLQLNVAARDGAQALFVWNAEDGLENGEYVLYVVTANEIAGLNDQAFGLITGTSAILGALADQARDSEIRFDIDAYTDRNADRRVWTGTPDPFPFTDNPIAQTNLFEPGGSFGAQYDLSPAPNGVIRYGTVRVENNFLAVHLRNRSAAGVLNRVSRVVLAPKNRTTGRININTIQTRRTFAGSATPRVFNALTGTPGTLLGYFEQDPPVWGIDPANNAGDPAPAERSDFITYRDAVYARDTAVLTNAGMFPARSTLDPAMAFRASVIAANRAEHADGRYYEFAADTVIPVAVFENPDTSRINRIVNPAILSDLIDRDIIVPTIPTPAIVETFSTPPANVVEPLRFDENFNRFRRLANTVTTRSDVFEIIVTVQSGFGIDANNDGRINWRDDAEFRANATKRARSVYER